MEEQKNLTLYKTQKLYNNYQSGLNMIETGKNEEQFQIHPLTLE